MDVLKRFEALKDKQEKLDRQIANLEGKRDQLISSLQIEFEIPSLNEAKKKLETMEKDLKKRQARAESLLTELEELLNGSDNGN